MPREIEPPVPSSERAESRFALRGNLYAHSLPDQLPGEWQRLDSHLNGVAILAARFAQEFQSSVWAQQAGLLHDLGKAAREFQAYLRRENHIDDPAYDGESGRVNHSSAGAAFAEECKGLPGRALAYAIAGHHAGLPDYYVADGCRGALTIRVKEGADNLERIRDAAEEVQAGLEEPIRFPSFVKSENFHFWIRMLFSCLVDADYLDTESFMQPDRALQRGASGAASLSGLKAAMDRRMDALSAGCEPTSVNKMRARILSACREAAANKPGLYSLTVPTGGGKTLAAMTFALDHAILHGKKRVIYVIPYTSIIEQTAEILGNIFGRENVIEHHSNLAPEKETLRNQMASENWDAPIVVTTNVQFFESLYAARPSHCRKLHSLVESVVILDEAQMVPPNLLSPCVAAINELTLNYGVTLVLATATQPALPKLRPPTEIIPSALNLYKSLRRVEISMPQDMQERIGWEELAHKLREFDQVLCIVNIRRACYDLFQAMPDGTIHLSASMCGEHRSKIIALIKQRLKKGQTLRVISTQLVEAGVDIDFPVVYRALAGLDSIAQAAGRCNREGKLGRDGQVVVFIPLKSAPDGLLHKGECTTRELLTLDDFDPHAPEWYTRYFDLFYGKVNDTGKKYLEDLTPSDSNVLDVCFRSVGEKFKLIDDRQQAIVVIYGTSPKLIERLRVAGPKREIMRRLQRYTVNIPQPTAASMLHDGRLEMLASGIVVQTFAGDYREDIGLNIFGNSLPPGDWIL